MAASPVELACVAVNNMYPAATENTATTAAIQKLKWRCPMNGGLWSG